MNSPRHLLEAWEEVERRTRRAGGSADRFAFAILFGR